MIWIDSSATLFHDILILCKSKRSSEKAKETAVKYLEKVLKLSVNKEKTHISNGNSGIKYLGTVISDGYTVIQEKKLKSFKLKVKKITRRNSPVNLEQVIKELNPVMRGFVNYFRICNCKGKLEELMGWIRRRLRAKQLKLWKTPNKLHKQLRRMGHYGEFDKIKMSSWKNACSQVSHLAMPNDYFMKRGLFDMTKVKTGNLVPC